jgi:hypothetical protein
MPNAYELNNWTDRTRTTAYQWCITEDVICGGDDVGVVGPYAATMTADEIRTHPERKMFRMYDDDGEHCYSGFFVGAEEEMFGPLDDFGTPNVGGTELRYRKGSNGAFETL